MAQAFNLTARINLQGPFNLKPIVSKIKKDIGGIKPELKFKLDASAAKSVKTVTAEIKKLDAAAKSAKKSVGSLNSQLQSLASSFNAATTASKNAVNATNNVVRATSTAAKSANQARTAIEEFGKQSGLAIKRFAAFSSVTTVIFGVTNAITDAYKEFLVFNKEIVRLSQVTNKSVSDLQGISDEITRLSTTLGVTSSDLITVASTLAQAGLSAQDTKVALEALAKSALAPSFENIIQTTEGSIAAIRQFGLEAGELESALGSINSVAAAFAVEAGDIIAAIQRTGGVFASASRGVSEGTDALNEFIAIFTSVRQTTRESAETIATGLRTIFTRIQRSSTIELLKQYGIELRDLEGKFVGPFEAVKRLSEGLSGIDPRSADFAKISEELGGFRQIGKVIPLIQQFAVAQDALNVAQKGSGSLSKDAITAQQSLSVQFEKTRQNFLALVRELGDSTSFKVFVSSALVLTNSLVDLGRILKPLLPLLLTFGAIKAGGGLTQFASGFGSAFNRGGGTGGSPAGGGGPTAPSGGGGGGNQPLTSALALNVGATNSLIQTITSLNTSVLALNQNIVNTNSLLLNRPPRGFATGGLVPGSGNSDTVSARLTPGEFVIRKKAVEAIGVDNLARMNRGGQVQRFAQGRGVKGRKGARSKFRDLDENELDQLSTADLIKYAKAQARNIFTTGGSGMATSMKFIEVPAERIVPELEGDLTTYLGKKGFWSEQVSPFGRSISKGKKTDAGSRTSAMQLQMSKQADEVAARSQQWSSISSGSGIDNYLLQSLTDPILSDYKTVRGGGSLDKAFHNTRLRKAVNTALESYDDFDYSANNIDKLVSNMAAKRFAGGGLVQKFAQGSPGGVKQPKLSSEEYKQLVQQRVKENSGNILEFGLVGLRSGLSNAGAISQNFSETQITPKTQTPVKINVATIAQNYSDALGQELETKLFNSFKSSVKNIAGTLSGKLPGGGALINDNETIDKIINNAGFTGVVGAGLEAALGLIGAPYIEKQEKTKSIDFPLGLGGAAGLFGIDPNIPTDATRTIGGYGKSVGGILGQIDRYLEAKSSGAFVEAEANKMSIMQAQSLTPMLESIKSRVPKGSGIAAMDSAKAKELRDKYGLKSGGLNIPSLTSSLQRLPSDQQRPFLDDLSAFLSGKGYANGGSVEDTVPALLTPGEFVVSKPAAKSIGYGNLARMNQADKIKGFNKGGIVGPQKFAIGGAVTSDPAALVAVLTGVLIPQVQRLGETFGKLQGDVGNFGAALGGAVREASSIVLSASIGLRAVGASETTVRRAQIGGGIAASVGGALTDVGNKLLNKALQENTRAITKFEKSLQDAANASTEELKLEAAKKVEQNFLALDSTIRQTKDNIDKLENIKNFGETVSNATLTVLTTITAMTALAAASKQASLAVIASRAPGAVVTGAAYVSTGTKLLAGFGKLIPVVGGLISIFSIGIELFSFFNNKLKSTDEQFERLNTALRETINLSNDYNLANENFVNTILPQFRNLVEQGSGKPLDISRQIGSLTENSLNITRNFLIKQSARAQGLNIGTTENIDDVRTRISGQANLEKILTSAIGNANKRYIQEGFSAAMKEKGITNSADIAAEAQKLGGVDSKAVIQIAQDYFGELDRRLLAERNLSLASRDLKVNMINLSNTVNNLESIFNRSLSNLEIDFKNLNRNIDILVEDIKLQSSTVLEKNIQILENLKQSTPQEISKALSSVRPSLGPVTKDGAVTDQTKAFAQIADAVQSNAILQQRTDIVLNKISQLGLQGEQTKELLNQELKGILVSSLGNGPGAESTASTLIDELAAAIQKGGNEGKPITGFQEAASRVDGFGSLISELDSTTKSFTSILKIRQQAEQQVIDSLNRELELRSKFTELSIQRQQTEIRNNISLKRTLGQRVSLEEINQEFLSQIRQLTGNNVPGLDLTGGQITATEVNAIAKELSDARSEISRRESQAGEGGRLALLTSQSYTMVVNKANNLNKALQEVANSGALVNNTFEEIGKQKDLLKSQEQLLFDLIKDSGDPTKSAEINRIIAAVVAVQNKTATMRQAELAVEKGGPLVTAMKGQEAGDAFLRNARMLFFNQMEKLTRSSSTPEELVTVQQVLADLVTQRYDIPKPAKTAMDAERAAQESIMDPVAQSIIKSMNTTSTIFNNFNNDIAVRFATLLQTLRDIEGRVQSRATIPSQSQIPESLRNSIVGAIDRLSNTTVERNINASQRLQAIPVPAITTKTRAEEALRVIGTGDAEQIRKALDQLRIDIVEKGTGVLGPTESFRETRVNKLLSPIIQELTRYLDQVRVVPQKPPASKQLNLGPGFNQGSFLDPSSKRTLDGFSTTTKDLATALTGENNTITQLSEAVKSLTPVINTFKIAAEALASKIGPDGTITINQTAQSNVNVRFDEALQVDVPTDNRSNTLLADNIRTLIENQISSLKREIGLV